VTCAPLSVPGSAVLSAQYVKAPMSETTFSVREWSDSGGRNLLVLELEWSLLMNPQFPQVATVSGGLTAGSTVIFFWQGCSADLASCQKKYLIYDGTMTVNSATRGPQGSIDAVSAAGVTLHETNANGDYAVPGSCLSLAPMGWSATYLCHPDGSGCTAASDCCTNVCSAQSTCGTPPVCKADGQTCTAASQCCTNQCNGGVCGAPVCKADGLSCTAAPQCCTNQCNGGLCGAPVCKADGLSCTAASQCCTNQCNGGLCGAPLCKADGLSCTAASQCCSFACSGGLCGSSSGSCNPVTDTGCTAGNDCILLSSETTTCAIGGFGVQGDSCSATVTCAGGYGCFAGTCRKICKTSTGQGCTSPSVCNGVTGWVTYGACT
jgi:hypothetical protein